MTGGRLRRTRVGPCSPTPTCSPTAAASTPSIRPTPYQGLFFKSLGVTNVAGFAYGVSPSSIASIKDLKESLVTEGMQDALREPVPALRRGRLHQLRPGHEAGRRRRGGVLVRAVLQHRHGRGGQAGRHQAEGRP